MGARSSSAALRRLATLIAIGIVLAACSHEDPTAPVPEPVYDEVCVLVNGQLICED